MSRFVVRLRSKIFVVLTMVLSASCLSIPAQAAEQRVGNYISAVRIDATDQLVLSNQDEQVTVRFDFVDPVYGPQSVTLAPATSNGLAPMCAVPADSNPNPVITVTVNPDTASATTGSIWFYSVSGSDYSPEYFEQLVATKTAAVVKVKHKVVKAKAAVKKAAGVLANAKASHKASWIASATRWLAKTKARRNQLKSKLATLRTELKSAKLSLLGLQEEMAYCESHTQG